MYGGHSNLQVDWCWPIIGLEVPRLQDLHRPGHGTQPAASRSTGWEVGWLAGWCLPHKLHPITKLKRFQVIPAANKCYSKVSGETTSLPIQVDTQRGYLPRDTSIAEPGRSLLVLAPSSSTCTWKAWFSSTQGTWWIHDMTKTTVHFPPPHLQLCGSVVLPKAKKLLQFWGVQRNEILTAKVMPILQILWLSWQKEA